MQWSDQRQGHGAGELVHATLAGVVAGDAGDGHHAVHRAHVHDGATLPALHHFARHGLAHQEGALQVDGQHRVPVGFAHVQEIGRLEDAGVVHQRVQAAEGGHAGGGGGLHLRRIGHVAGLEDTARTEGRQFIGQRLPACGVHIPQRQVRAFGRQAARAGRTNALRGTGHHGAPAGQVEMDLRHARPWQGVGAGPKSKEPARAGSCAWRPVGLQTVYQRPRAGSLPGFRPWRCPSWPCAGPPRPVRRCLPRPEA